MILSTMKENNIIFSSRINVQTCRKHFEYFKNKFDILKNIQENDKIGKVMDTNEKEEKNAQYFINGNYCIYSSGSLQKWSRWWYNENHEKTFEYIDKDFSLFAKFLDSVKNNRVIEGKILYSKLTLEIIEFNNDVIKGLYRLKQTYENNPKLKAKIDSIIMILFDFKNENSD